MEKFEVCLQCLNLAMIADGTRSGIARLSNDPLCSYLNGFNEWRRSKMSSNVIMQSTYYLEALPGTGMCLKAIPFLNALCFQCSKRLSCKQGCSFTPKHSVTVFRFGKQQGPSSGMSKPRNPKIDVLHLRISKSARASGSAAIALSHW
jgi:hypothetical protein